MKNFISNIPLYLATPFILVNYLLDRIIIFLTQMGLKLHMKFETDIGKKVRKEIESIKKLNKSLQELGELMNKVAELDKKRKTASVLSSIKANGKKNGPTYH